MPSLPVLDRLALMVLLPLWAFAWLSTARTLDCDVVVVPFFVDGARTPTDLPVVRGFPSWTRAARQPEPALAVGDRVVAVGGAPVAGASAEQVVALAWTHMGSDAVLDVEVERGGRALDAGVAIPASVPKWPLLPVSLAFAVMAVGAVLGGRRHPALRAAWPAFFASALWLGSFFGRTPGELQLAFWMRGAAMVVIQPLYVRLLRFFPTGSDEGVRWARGWPWLLALNGLVVVDMELYGRLPPWVTDYVPKLDAAVFAALLLTIGTLNFRRAAPVERRRFKWLMLGAWIAVVPPATVSALSAFRPELGRLYLPSQLSQLAIPLSLGVGVWRHRLWDIDRLLNAGIVYLGAAGLATIVFVAGTGPAQQALASSAGLAPDTADLALALALAALLVPAAVAGRAALDRAVLRDQRARERAVEQLIPAVGRCAKLDEIAALLAARLPAIFDASGALVLAEGGKGLVPVQVTAGAPEPDAAGRATLARAATPCDLRVGLGIPVRDAVAGVPLLAVVLGPRPPGEEYTPGDRTLLAWVAERAAATARALREDERLTAAHRMAAELAGARDRAEVASRDKTALLATASHDLRQPLHALGLLVGALESRVSGEEARALLRRVKTSALSVEQRFGTLLDVARLESGALVPEVVDGVPLAPLFEELEAATAPLAREKGIALRVRPPRHGQAVRSDPVLLRSVLENLVVNAVRYTERGGVLVAARRRGDRIHLEVRDTGAGIRPEERERLFAAWQRGEPGGAEGTGLGLAIVRRLVDLLGHGLSLRSTPGRGSVFSVDLEASRTRAPIPAGLEGHRVVLVEDEADARRAMTAAMAGFGLEVVAGADAAEVLAALHETPAPDLALVDLRLASGATGLEALASLEVHLGALPAAFVTGETDGPLLDAARATGHPVLRKPVAAVQLRAALQALLARSAERRR